MSLFLKLLRRRFERKNEADGDPVPWHLDDKHRAYKFVNACGWRTIQYTRCPSPQEALAAGRSYGTRFVVKQPNRHSGKGVYLLEDIGGDEFLNLMTMRVMGADAIQPNGPAPDYWLAEECIVSTVAGRPLPFDYKVYAFRGRIALIIQIDRNVWPPRIAVFDGAFLPLERGRHYETNPERWLWEHHVIPLHGPQILAMACDLSASLDTAFVRVDCFDGPSGPVFGEFTFASGAVDTGMIRFPTEVLQALDAAVQGEKIKPLSGIQVDMNALWTEAAERKGPIFHGHPKVLSALSGRAVQGDFHYARLLSEIVPQGRLGQHFQLAARMVGFLNGDKEQAFSIQAAIGKREGYVSGPAWRDWFQQVALDYHASKAKGNPWHTTRLAEIRLARGDRSALHEVRRLASDGYQHARRVLGGYDEA